MTKRTTAIQSATVLAIALAAFTGSALAANGKGNGAANSHATPTGQTASPSPGNSANAPGRLKKASATSTTASATAANRTTNTTGAKPGVKPSSSTSHNTTALVTSGQTKLYGNGQTAGEIAMRNGAPTTTMLFGPGNSQPHKVAACPQSAHGNGGGIDVHALKAGKASASCTTSVSTTQTAVQTVTPAMTQVFGAPATQATTPGSATVSSTPAAEHAGGVLGATAGVKAKGKPFGGVLGALTTIGHGTLPFTGFPLWIVAPIGAALLAGGLGLTRHARATI